MLPDIDTLAERRNKLGLSYKELSEKSKGKISQFTIRKIENKTITEPSYIKVKDLFDTIEKEEMKQKSSHLGKAADIHREKPITIKENVNLKTAYNLMNQNNFSQLPVKGEKGFIIGSITFDLLKDKIGDGENPKTFALETIKSLNKELEPPFPQVSLDTNNMLIALLLKENKAVLTTDNKGKIIGIITESDLLKIK